MTTAVIPSYEMSVGPPSRLRLLSGAIEVQMKEFRTIGLEAM